MRPFCKCGCGKLTTRSKLYPHNWNRFIHGHNSRGIKRSEEANKNNSKAQKGKKLSKETKIKMSVASKGKPKSEKHKRNISKSKSGYLNPNYHRKFSIEHKRKISQAGFGRIHSEETKRKIGKANKDRIFSKEWKKKIGEASKKRWQNIKYKERSLKALYKTLRLKPNKSERRLRNKLNKMFPGEYKFVGDGKVWINGKNPDFININGQKKIIELFGDYWHSKKITGIKKKEHRKQRQKIFAEYGYKTLVVWERLLKNIPKLEIKLKDFHYE